MPTGNLPQSVMTFFVISWASVFLQCEFKCCVSLRSQSPCGELPRAWLMISWHYIWPRVRAVAQRASEACCSGSRDRRHKVSSELWRFFVQLAEGTGTRVWCVPVCASSLDLSGMNNVWNSDGAGGEIISRSTLIKKMLCVTLSLSLWWRLYSKIMKQNVNQQVW